MLTRPDSSHFQRTPTLEKTATTVSQDTKPRISRLGPVSKLLHYGNVNFCLIDSETVSLTRTLCAEARISLGRSTRECSL
jgi:hypothetical protein